MMGALNVLAYCAQVTLLVLACAGLPRLLRLASPGAQYAFWRALLVLCLVLPAVQPWRRVVTSVTLTVLAAPGSDQARPGAGPSPMLPVPVVSFGFDVGAVARDILLTGAAARLAWIAFGMVRLRRMRRRATGAALGFDDLQETIGTAVPILWSPDVRHPVTFGFRRPVILLPAALEAVDLPAQRAVVAHELHHVKRRDWGWIVVEEIIRSVFWFHPVMWWLVSRVQLARETVVDELTILVTNARRTYLDTLLAFADDTGLASSPAFSARRHLFHRVMLLSKEGGMSSRHIAAASCVLIVALGAGTWGAVTAFPLYAAAQDRTPPRDPLTPAAHHRVAQEYWERANKDLSLTREEKLDAILKGIAADDRALAMNPDYVEALIYKNLFLRIQANLTADPDEQKRLIRQADELRAKAVALRGPLAPAPPPPPPPPPDPASAEFNALVAQLNPIRIGGQVATPTKIRDVKPAYPADARNSRVQGVVIVEALIDTEGTVVGAHVLRSIPMLDAAAQEAVRQWRFMPTLLNGVPQSVVMTVTINFTLD